MRRILFILILLVVGVSAAQEGERIREEVVYGFQDGMVTAVPHSLRPKNSLHEISNYVFTEDAFLQGPRPGFKLINSTDTSTDSGDVVEALIGYYSGTVSELLAVKRNTGTAAPAGIHQLVKIDSNGATLSELNAFFYKSWPNQTVAGFGYSHDLADSFLYIANQKQEMYVYDGGKVFPARPAGPGQIFALPFDTGRLVGKYSYRYTYLFTLDTGGAVPFWETNFSAPSFPVQPDSERVYLKDFLPPLDTTKFDIVIYRTKANGSVYYALDTLKDSTDTYTDFTPDDSLGDIANFSWGGGYHNAGVGASGSYEVTPDSQYVIGTIGFPDSTVIDSLFPPGAPHGFINNPSDTAHGNYMRGLRHHNDYISYYVVFLDSNGFFSYVSAPCFVRDTVQPFISYSNIDSVFSVELYNLPTVPTSGTNVKHRLLLRRAQAERTSRTTGTVDATINKFFNSVSGNAQRDSLIWDGVDKIMILDTLDFTTPYTSGSPYVDSVHIESLLTIGYPVFQGYLEFAPDTVLQFTGAETLSVQYSVDTTLYFPENIAANDSSIFFRPGFVALYGGRLYTAGRFDSRNRIQYSLTVDVGQEELLLHFPVRHTLDFPTGDGDIFNGLRSVEDGLMGPKSNTLISIRGFRFLDFKADRIFENFGSVAPGFVDVKGRTFVFLDEEGIFGLALSGGLNNLSLGIQDIFDSLGYDRVKRATGGFVGEDMWVSLPSASNDTLINDVVYIRDARVGGWLRYSDFGFQSFARFDFERRIGNWHSDRFVFGGAYGKLYRHGYGPADSLDNISDTVVTTIQSKFHFDGQIGRKKIEYIDLIGSGLIDSISMVVLGNNRGGTYDTLVTIDRRINFDSLGSRVRLYVNALASDVAFRMQSLTGSKHTIEGYAIGYSQWDEDDETR